MRVSYISHDGFFIECADCCLLFDYWKGELPAASDKPIYIFASHHHGDHYVPAIFDYGDLFPSASYILSDDIRPAREGDGVILCRADETIELPDLTVRTLGSTDCGVAFLVKLRTGETIYHAGDLHLWLFGKEDTPEEAEEMTERFLHEIDKLRGVKIDLAMLPLDPRQPRSQYWMGMDYCLRELAIAHAIPMHMWGRYGIIERFLQLPQTKAYAEKVIKIEKEGQSYEISDGTPEFQRV